MGDSSLESQVELTEHSHVDHPPNGRAGG